MGWHQQLLSVSLQGFSDASRPAFPGKGSSAPWHLLAAWGPQPRVPLLEWWLWGCTSETASPMFSPQVSTSFQVKRERKEMWVPRGPQVSGTSPWTERRVVGALCLHSLSPQASSPMT